MLSCKLKHNGAVHTEGWGPVIKEMFTTDNGISGPGEAMMAQMDRELADLLDMDIHGDIERETKFLEKAKKIKKEWKDYKEKKKAQESITPPSSQDLLVSLYLGFHDGNVLTQGSLIYTGAGMIKIEVYQGYNDVKNKHMGVDLVMTLDANEENQNEEDLVWLQTIIQNKNVDSEGNPQSSIPVEENWVGSKFEDNPSRTANEKGEVYFMGTVSLVNKKTSTVHATFEWGFSVQSNGRGTKYDLRYHNTLNHISGFQRDYIFKYLSRP